MKVRGWHIEGYRIFRDHHVRDLPDGLVVVFGANEAGKSTLLAFLRGILFGFPDGRGRESQYPPFRGGRHAGRVFLEGPDGLYIVEREADRRATARITLPNGQEGVEEDLRRLLGQADATLFRNLFAFSLVELQDLTTLTDEAVRNRIFSAGVVGAGRSAREALSELNGRMAVLLKSRGQARINVLVSELQQKQIQLDEARRAARSYPDLLAAEERASVEVARLRGAIDAERQSAEEARLLVELWPVWHRRREAEQELDMLDLVDSFPSEGEVRFERALERLSADQDALAALGQDQEADEEDRQRLSLDDTIFCVAERADALSGTIALQRDRLGAVSQLRSRRDAVRVAFDDTLSDLGPGWDRGRLTSFDLSIPSTEVVRAWEEQLRNGQRKIEGAEAAHRQAVREEASKRAAKDLIERECRSVPEPPTSDILDERESVLRRLRALLTNLSDTERWRQPKASLALDCQRRVGSIKSQEPFAFPSQVPLALGTGSFVCAVGAAWRFLMHDTWLGLVLVLLALIIAGGTYVARLLSAYAKERRRRWGEELATVQSDLERASSELDDVRRASLGLAEEVAKAAHELGLADRPSAQDTEDAEAHMMRERESRRHFDALLDRLGESVAELDRAEEATGQARSEEDEAGLSHAELQSRWTGWKHQTGVPENLSPQGVLDFFERIRAGRERLRTLEEIESDLERIEREIQDWESRGREALGLVGLADESVREALIDRVATLTRQVADERRSRERAESLDETIHRRSLQMEQGRRKVLATEEQMRALLAEAGANDEADLRRRAGIYHRRRELRGDLRECELQLVARLGEGEPAGALRAEVVRGATAEWHEAAGQADRNIQDFQAQYEAAIRDHHSARLAREAVENVADVVTIAQELTSLEAELAEATREWRIHALAQGLIRETLIEFERTRQPAVLEEASRVFERVTGGRYVRVVQRAGLGTFDVMDAAGGRRAPEALSRGTAEQLYLAVRLGLARDFATRTVELPLVMDDVTVNFDPDRAMAAAAALADFSRGNQVLFFTCHPEIASMLETLAPGRGRIDLPVYEPVSVPTHEDAGLGLGDVTMETAGEDYERMKDLLRERGEITSQDAQEILGLDAAGVRPYLRRLVAEGLAIVEGHRRGTRYRRRSDQNASSDSSGERLHDN